MKTALVGIALGCFLTGLAGCGIPMGDPQETGMYLNAMVGMQQAEAIRSSNSTPQTVNVWVHRR